MLPRPFLLLFVHSLTIQSRNIIEHVLCGSHVLSTEDTVVQKDRTSAFMDDINQWNQITEHIEYQYKELEIYLKCNGETLKDF